MKTITVKKQKLLEALENNMKTHIEEYNEMKIIYMEKAIEGANELLSNLQNGNFNIELNIALDRPRTSEKEYKRAIEMLAWEVNDKVTITENEYNSYIKDEWNFSRNFALSKAAYLGL